MLRNKYVVYNNVKFFISSCKTMLQISTCPLSQSMTHCIWEMLIIVTDVTWQEESLTASVMSYFNSDQTLGCGVNPFKWHNTRTRNSGCAMEISTEHNLECSGHGVRSKANNSYCIMKLICSDPFMAFRNNINLFCVGSLNRTLNLNFNGTKNI